MILLALGMLCYFNIKHKRVGPLFQGVYKAVRVTSEEQLLYLTKYIHRNPDPDGSKRFNHTRTLRIQCMDRFTMPW